MRYYFNLTDGAEVIRDEEGLDVSDVQAAIISAVAAIKELRAEDASAAQDWQGWRLEIVDATGQVLESIPLDAPVSH